jgi:hypothetical protein
MYRRIRAMDRCASLLVVAVCGLAVGCGPGTTGNRLSGKVTFKGQPVPAGRVQILPDTAKGNKGTAGYANIQNGTYDTSASGGQGAVSGAVIITVEGIDPKPPPGASPDVTTTILFSNYQLSADLPAGDSEKDIDVPETAAQQAPAGEGGAPAGIVP